MAFGSPNAFCSFRFAPPSLRRKALSFIHSSSLQSSSPLFGSLSFSSSFSSSSVHRSSRDPLSPPPSEKEAHPFEPPVSPSNPSNPDHETTHGKEQHSAFTKDMKSDIVKQIFEQEKAKQSKSQKGGGKESGEIPFSSPPKYKSKLSIKTFFLLFATSGIIYFLYKRNHAKRQSGKENQKTATSHDFHHLVPKPLLSPIHQNSLGRSGGQTLGRDSH